MNTPSNGAARGCVGSGGRLWPAACLSALIALAMGGCSSRTDPVPAEGISAARFALAPPSDSEPVSAAMICNPPEVPAGRTVEVLVRVAIAGAHHIYARTPEGSPFLPTKLQMTLPSGVEALGDWSGPEPLPHRPGEFVYTDSVLFRRPLKVGANIADGPLSIRGELYYQACTDELCWPPRVLRFSTSLRVTPTTRP